ncbi:MAG: hypothetical protein Solumvirus5_5 [Solumvirus sp.]|uniref:Peptidase C14 caspase domain-containing protein n=1 Tax=Solumvirus sp. TaxID=2487773 RepID=A0A3G5AGS8_9VIRU|nr:MAG: hypothetical protein Solumvirus5_5 [Solumvirus sp.]
MPSAILIGFEYQVIKADTKDGINITTVFPNTVIDMNLVDQFCREQNWETKYITDIKEEKLPEGVHEVVVGGRVDLKSLTFYKNNNANFIMVDTRKKFLEVFTSEIIRLSKGKDKKLFVYYTGHGIGDKNGKSSILLPNDEQVSFTEVREIITKYFFSDGDIVCILDCCYPSSMDLPYQYVPDMALTVEITTDINKSTNTKHVFDATKEGDYSDNLQYPPIIHRTGKWKLIEPYTACRQKFLLITSASNSQVSAADKFGSFFTGAFFQYLRLLNHDLKTTEKTSYKWPSRNLLAICKEIVDEVNKHPKVKQSTTIYSAYKELPIIPLWIGAFNIDILVDAESKLLLFSEIVDGI